MANVRIRTPRLILREWEARDLDPFAAMCADSRVMETLGPVMDRQQTAELIARISTLSERDGHTFWAMERQEDGLFLGWCGLIRGTAPVIDGKMEIGWRLAHHAWQQGYAKEAALACLEWGFAHQNYDAIWAITSAINNRSWGLMERIGMRRHLDLDFDHPSVAADSPLKRHVTYSIARA